MTSDTWRFWGYSPYGRKESKEPSMQKEGRSMKRWWEGVAGCVRPVVFSTVVAVGLVVGTTPL